MPEPRIAGVLRMAKELTRLVIAEGGAEETISQATLAWDSNRHISISARGLRKHWWSRSPFTIWQAAVAVNLLERCGYAEEIYEEMFAYVFVGKVQVGYIWLKQGFKPDLGQGNGTADTARGMHDVGRGNIRN